MSTRGCIKMSAMGEQCKWCHVSMAVGCVCLTTRPPPPFAPGVPVLYYQSAINRRLATSPQIAIDVFFVCCLINYDRALGIMFIKRLLSARGRPIVTAQFPNLWWHSPVKVSIVLYVQYEQISQEVTMLESKACRAEDRWETPVTFVVSQIVPIVPMVNGACAQFLSRDHHIFISDQAAHDQFSSPWGSDQQYRWSRHIHWSGL